MINNVNDRNNKHATSTNNNACSNPTFSSTLMTSPTITATLTTTITSSGINSLMSSNDATNKQANKHEKEKKDPMAGIDVNNYASVVIIDNHPEVSIDDPSFLFEKNEGFQEVTSRKALKSKIKAAQQEEALKQQQLQQQQLKAQAAAAVAAAATSKKGVADKNKASVVSTLPSSIISSSVAVTSIDRQQRSSDKLIVNKTGRPKDSTKRSTTSGAITSINTSRSMGLGSADNDEPIAVLPKIENWTNDMAKSIPISTPAQTSSVTSVTVSSVASVNNIAAGISVIDSQEHYQQQQQQQQNQQQQQQQLGNVFVPHSNNNSATTYGIPSMESHHLNQQLHHQIHHPRHLNNETQHTDDGNKLYSSINAFKFQMDRDWDQQQIGSNSIMTTSAAYQFGQISNNSYNNSNSCNNSNNIIQNLMSTLGVGTKGNSSEGMAGNNNNGENMQLVPSSVSMSPKQPGVRPGREIQINQQQQQPQQQTSKVLNNLLTSDEIRTIKKPDASLCSRQQQPQAANRSYETMDIQSTLFNYGHTGEDTTNMKMDFPFDANLTSKLPPQSETSKKLLDASGSSQSSTVVSGNRNHPTVTNNSCMTETDQDLNYKLARVKDVWDRENDKTFDQGLIVNCYYGCDDVYLWNLMVMH
ncbi:hypothetical protein HELRODRAFT_179518 [Helobdella robusta]|uniref:BAT2 N-terminal domain-containing protein n=1 Tax=Helobdella robusta TaxID=6412 RepID=T1FEU1_HELRO|nr:hypothetical protein HELRODRAFT_179518 [Helobdella robusta]ESN95441.1 hypothetical protein HELRODRAFT_179518 [Helobdella robusta]